MRTKMYRTARPSSPSPLTRPERHLWRAVLIQAARDASGRVSHVKTPEQRDRAQSAALRWINSPAHQTGSFIWVCHHLKCDPDRLRDRLAKGQPIPTNRELRDQEIIALFRQGQPLKAIARTVGCSYGHVTKLTRPMRQGKVLC